MINLRIGSDVETSSRESHCLCVCVCVYFIQGDSGRKVNILGGDSIVHCEETIPFKHVSNSEWFKKTDFFESSNKKHCE